MRLGQEGVYISPPIIRKKHATNGDLIRFMTDGELAVKLAGIACPPNHKNPITECEVTGHPCYECWLDWLKQEADDGSH